VADNFVVTSSVLMSRRALDMAGLFDPALRSVEDRDLWLRIAADTPVWFTPEALVVKRTRAEGLSQDPVLAALSRLHVMRKLRRQQRGRVRAMGATWRRHLAEVLADAAYAQRMRGRRASACLRYAESFLVDPRPLPLRGMAATLLRDWRGRPRR
jgi:hypothetical protein